MKKRGSDNLSWLHEGTRFEEWTRDAKRRPFCQERVEDERVESINLVASDNGEEIAKIKTLSESPSANGIEVGNLFVPDNMRKAIDVIMHADQALEAYSRLLKIVEYNEVMELGAMVHADVRTQRRLDFENRLMAFRVYPLLRAPASEARRHVLHAEKRHSPATSTERAQPISEPPTSLIILSFSQL